jgi:hypothetical protein
VVLGRDVSQAQETTLKFHRQREALIGPFAYDDATPLMWRGSSQGGDYEPGADSVLRPVRFM